MPQAATTTPLAAGHDLVTMARGAAAAAEAIFSDAAAKVRERVAVDGRIVSRTFDREQRATHGLAWLATYVEAVRQLTAYAERMQSTGRLGEIEELLVRIGLGEYLAQILGGIPISQGEIVRLSDLGLTAQAVAARVTPEVDMLIASGNTAIRRARLVELMRGQQDRDGRRLRPRRHAGIDPRGNAQVRRQRGDRPRAGLAPHQQLYPDGCHRPDGGPRRVRPHHPRGIRRHGARQGIDVRRLRGVVARLYRCRLARHPHRDRGRAHPRRRHRRTEEEVAAEAGVRRDPADRGVHRAEHRLRPRIDEDARDTRWREIQGAG